MSSVQFSNTTQISPDEVNNEICRPDEVKNENTDCIGINGKYLFYASIAAFSVYRTKNHFHKL